MEPLSVKLMTGATKAVTPCFARSTADHPSTSRPEVAAAARTKQRVSVLRRVSYATLPLPLHHAHIKSVRAGACRGELEGAVLAGAGGEDERALLGELAGAHQGVHHRHGAEGRVGGEEGVVTRSPVSSGRTEQVT